MQITFPENFLWGTSTAAAQIETASDHDWRGFKARDGYVFGRTADHELHRDEDIGYITRLGNAYRMGLDWARLQTGPNAKFDPEVVEEYRSFMAKLKARNVYIMLVLHHFTNPSWFARSGGWENPASVGLYLNYAQQIADNFGDLVDNWNTFNEPGVYTVNGWLTGLFPPCKKSWFTFRKVLDNIVEAHRHCIPMLKQSHPGKPVGISKNTVVFAAENLAGRMPAKLADRLFMQSIPDRFVDGLDYIGISYYAKIGFDPLPITELDKPGKLAKMGRLHDKMWEYHPDGLETNVMRFHKRYGLPIIITENGICTDDCSFRISSIKDYLLRLHRCMEAGVDVRGYFHWSTLDNFEWNLGPTYRFGLVGVDYATGKRTMKESGRFYGQVAKTGRLEV